MSIDSDLYYNLKKKLEDAKNKYKHSLWSDVPLSDIEELEEVADKILLALGNQLLTGEDYEKEIGYEEEEEPLLGYEEVYYNADLNMFGLSKEE